MTTDRYSKTLVRSYSTGTPGRALVNARNHHFVVDGPSYAGSPGEEIGSGEAFLAGIVSCAVNMVERLARESQIPLQWVNVTAESVRDNEAAPLYEDVSVFNQMHMNFELTGIDDDQAQELVAAYRRR